MASKAILILWFALLALSLVDSHPRKRRHEKKEEQDKTIKIKMTKAVQLSEVRNPEWIGKEMGMTVFKEQYFGVATPLVLKVVYTNNPAHVTPSGSIRFIGINLASDTLLSLHFKTAINTSFTDAIMRFQLESSVEKSSVKSIYVDTMDSMCPIQGSELFHEMHCTRLSSPYSSTDDMLIIDGVPVPDFDDFEVGGSGIGTLHVSLDDEEGNLLMDGRFFVKKVEEDDE